MSILSNPLYQAAKAYRNQGSGYAAQPLYQEESDKPGDIKAGQISQGRSTAGQVATSALSGAGHLLDLPGSVARDFLTWLPGGPEARNPFDQLLDPLGRRAEENRIEGREFLRESGMVGKKDHWGNFAAGIGFEIATDPLTYLFPLGALTKTAGVLKKTGLVQNIDELAREIAVRAGKSPRRFGTAGTLRKITGKKVFNHIKGQRDDAIKNVVEKTMQGNRVKGKNTWNSIDELHDLDLDKMRLGDWAVVDRGGGKASSQSAKEASKGYHVYKLTEAADGTRRFERVQSASENLQKALNENVYSGTMDELRNVFRSGMKKQYGIDVGENILEHASLAKPLKSLVSARLPIPGGRGHIDYNLRKPDVEYEQWLEAQPAYKRTNIADDLGPEYNPPPVDPGQGPLPTQGFTPTGPPSPATMGAHAADPLGWEQLKAHAPSIRDIDEAKAMGLVDKQGKIIVSPEGLEATRILHQMAAAQGTRAIESFPVLMAVAKGTASLKGKTLDDYLSGLTVGRYGKAVQEGYMSPGMAQQAAETELRGVYDLGERAIKLFETGDIDTLHHEFIHDLRQMLPPAQQRRALELVKRRADELKQAGKLVDADGNPIARFAAQNADGTWTSEAEELFAEAWEAFSREGVTEIDELQPIFTKMRDWFINIYKTIVELWQGQHRHGAFEQLDAKSHEFFENLMRHGSDPKTTQFHKGSPGINAALNLLYKDVSKAGRKAGQEKIKNLKEWLEEQRKTKKLFANNKEKESYLGIAILGGKKSLDDIKDEAFLTSVQDKISWMEDHFGPDVLKQANPNVEDDIIDSLSTAYKETYLELAKQSGKTVDDFADDSFLQQIKNQLDQAVQGKTPGGTGGLPQAMRRKKPKKGKAEEDLPLFDMLTGKEARAASRLPEEDVPEAIRDIPAETIEEGIDAGRISGDEITAKTTQEAVEYSDESKRFAKNTEELQDPKEVLLASGENISDVTAMSSRDAAQAASRRLNDEGEVILEGMRSESETLDELQEMLDLETITGDIPDVPGVQAPMQPGITPPLQQQALQPGQGRMMERLLGRPKRRPPPRPIGEQAPLVRGGPEREATEQLESAGRAQWEEAGPRNPLLEAAGVEVRQPTTPAERAQSQLGEMFGTAADMTEERLATIKGALVRGIRGDLPETAEQAGFMLEEFMGKEAVEKLVDHIANNPKRLSQQALEEALEKGGAAAEMLAQGLRDKNLHAIRLAKSIMDNALGEDATSAFMKHVKDPVQTRPEFVHASEAAYMLGEQAPDILGEAARTRKTPREVAKGVTFGLIDDLTDQPLDLKIEATTRTARDQEVQTKLINLLAGRLEKQFAHHGIRLRPGVTAEDAARRLHNNLLATDSKVGNQYSEVMEKIVRGEQQAPTHGDMVSKILPRPRRTIEGRIQEQTIAGERAAVVRDIPAEEKFLITKQGADISDLVDIDLLDEAIEDQMAKNISKRKGEKNIEGMKLTKSQLKKVNNKANHLAKVVQIRRAQIEGKLRELGLPTTPDKSLENQIMELRFRRDLANSEAMESAVREVDGWLNQIKEAQQSAGILMTPSIKKFAAERAKRSKEAASEIESELREMLQKKLFTHPFDKPDANLHNYLSKARKGADEMAAGRAKGKGKTTEDIFHNLNKEVTKDERAFKEIIDEATEAGSIRELLKYVINIPEVVKALGLRVRGVDQIHSRMNPLVRNLHVAFDAIGKRGEKITQSNLDLAKFRALIRYADAKIPPGKEKEWFEKWLKDTTEMVGTGENKRRVVGAKPWITPATEGAPPIVRKGSSAKGYEVIDQRGYRLPKSSNYLNFAIEEGRHILGIITKALDGLSPEEILEKVIAAKRALPEVDPFDVQVSNWEKQLAGGHKVYNAAGEVLETYPITIDAKAASGLTQRGYVLSSSAGDGGKNVGSVFLRQELGFRQATWDTSKDLFGDFKDAIRVGTSLGGKYANLLDVGANLWYSSPWVRQFYRLFDVRVQGLYNYDHQLIARKRYRAIQRAIGEQREGLFAIAQLVSRTGAFDYDEVLAEVRKTGKMGKKQAHEEATRILNLRNNEIVRYLEEAVDETGTKSSLRLSRSSGIRDAQGNLIQEQIFSNQKQIDQLTQIKNILDGVVGHIHAKESILELRRLAQKEAGLASGKLEDTIKYFPRKGVLKHHEPDTNQLLFSVELDSQRRRAVAFRELPGGQSVLNEMSVDKEISGIYWRQMRLDGKLDEDNFQKATQYILDRYGDRVLHKEDYTINGKIKKAHFDDKGELTKEGREKLGQVALAIGALPEEHAQKGLPLFGRNFIHDLASYVEQSIAHEGVARNLQELVVQNAARTGGDQATNIVNLFKRVKMDRHQAYHNVIRNLGRDAEYQMFSRKQLANLDTEIAHGKNAKWKIGDEEMVITRDGDGYAITSLEDRLKHTERGTIDVAKADVVRRYTREEMPEALNMGRRFADTHMADLIINRETYDAAVKWMKPFIEPESISSVRKITQGLLQAFKLNVTVPFPAFHMRNFVSGQTMNWFYGFTDPTTRIPLMSILKPVKQAYTLRVGQKAIKNIYEEMPENVRSEIRETANELLHSGITLRHPLLRGQIGAGGTAGAAHFASSSAVRDIATTEWLRRKVFGSAIIGDKMGKSAEEVGETLSNVLSQIPGGQPREQKWWTGFGMLRKPQQAATWGEKINVLQARGMPGMPTAYKDPITGTRTWDFPRQEITTSSIHRFGEDMASGVEDLNRIAPFIALIKQGYVPEEAARLVNRVQVNYQALSEFEKRWAKQIFPFWTFSSRMVPVIYGDLLSNPGGKQAWTIRTANRMQEDDYEHRLSIPDWVRRGTSIPVGQSAEGDQRYITGLGLALEDPLGFARPPWTYEGGKEILGELGSRTRPELQFLAEKITGRHMYFDRNLEDMDPSLGRLISNVQNLATGERPEGLAEPWPSRFVEEFISKSPASRVIGTLKKLTDTRKGEGWKAINLLTGLKETTVTPEAQLATSLDRATEALKERGGRMAEFPYMAPWQRERLEGEQLTEVEALESFIKDLQRRRRERSKEAEQLKGSLSGTAGDRED